MRMVGQGNLCSARIASRHPTHGFALLTTLATILLLATLVLTLQTRSQSNLRLLARLATDLQDRAAKDSLHDRLRGLIADTTSAAANPGAPTDGRPTLDTSPDSPHLVNGSPVHRA